MVQSPILRAVDESRSRILESLPLLESESVPRERCIARISSEDIGPYPVSAMDGYALRFDDVPQPPVRLRNTGISRAGERFAGALSDGQCVRIFTDGVVPPGADVIVLQEDATESESDVIIDKIPKKGAHIRYAGLDFCFDQVCVPVQGKSVPQACRDAGISLLMRMTTAEKKRQRS